MTTPEHEPPTPPAPVALAADAPRSVVPAGATASPLQGLAAPISADAAVPPRADVAVDAAALRVTAGAAVKENVFASAAGRPSGRAHWQTRLRVEAWVRAEAPDGAARAWADVHVFGHDGALVARDTCPLVPAEEPSDGGRRFRLDCVAYEGATATPGSAEPRPDARLVQYRVYAEADGRALTDGVLHECVLKADVVSV
jgi:hypothetical protein